MQRDIAPPSPQDPSFRPVKTRLWLWALWGLLVVALFWLTASPAWAVALSLAGLCFWCVVWFQRDEPPQAIDTWHNWVCGWYWQTDADHQLKIFKPGVNLPNGVGVDWAVLSHFLNQRPLWLAIWPAANEAGSDLNRLRYCLDQRQAWDGSLTLPWPDGLKGLHAQAQPWSCTLRGHPRFDHQGRFMGFEGVLTPMPVPVAEPSVDVSVLAETTQMREAEQEALRYALSHDLRAPLRVVDGFTRIIKEDYGSALDRMGLDHLERVLAASARMNGMIDAILAQAQLAGAVLQRVDVDVSALATDIGAELTALTPTTARAEVIVVGDLHVQADLQLVRRVLENLIGNALKYSAKVAHPVVEFGVMPATNPAVFFVKDNGAGFDMQHADKLFGMFQRLHSAKEFPGTGVGLAGVHNIIRRHGGRIWAEASPGAGACFYFTLMDSLDAQQRSLPPASK